MQVNQSTLPTPQKTWSSAIVLHILPGVLVTLGFIALKTVLEPGGYPPLLAFLLAILLIDLPFMWGVLLWEGWKKNGRFSLDQVVLYRKKVSWKKFLAVWIGAFAAAYLLVVLSNPLTDFFKAHVFAGLPGWWFLDEPSQYQGYAWNVLVAILTFQLVLTGIVLPWTEELYFRGYLLPRIGRSGYWAPLLGGLLFGLYHSWQFFGFAGVFLLGTVLGYVVWWQRDIRLSISLHVAANLFARLAVLLAVLAQ